MNNFTFEDNMCFGDYFTMADIDFSPQSLSSCQSRSLSSLSIPSAKSSLSNIVSKAISLEINLIRAHFDDEANFNGEILALK